ncbi:MAG: TonB-dependent receptor [Pseudoxanthomonas sp.]
MTAPTRPRLLSRAIMLTLAAQACPAIAADAGAAVDDPATTALPAVVVTAEHRAESAQKIGASISVIGGEQLKEKSIDTVNDLQHATPSLEVEPAFGSGQPQFRLRGVGFIDYTSNNASTVGINVDGVAFALPIQTQGLLFDLDRVEILRGPQGTLYGRNTTGGTVNFITRRPTDTFQAGFTTDYGSYNAWSGEGYLSGPLTSTLKGRLSIASQQGGAWQKNRDTGEKLGDKNTLAVRGQLEWTPSDALDARLVLQHAYDKSDGQGLYLFGDYTSTSTGEVIAADRDRDATGWSLRSGFASAAGITGDKPYRDNSNDSAALHVDWDLGRARFSSITAFSSLERHEFSDWDATSYHDSDEYFHDKVKEFTQELRLASTGDGRFTWVGGAFYSHDRLDEKFYSDFSDRLGFAMRTSYVQTVKTLGGFGQASWQFSDRLKGVLGLRQEYEKRELDDFVSGYLADDGTVTSFAAFPAHQHFSNTGTSGKLALDYQLSDNSLLYASISRGYKSGGYTAHNTSNVTALAAFKPETLTAFEVGFKSDLGASLRLNGALFHYEYHDQQVLAAVWNEQSQSLVGTFVNAPRSRIDGGELELQWQPLAGLDIQQYLGYKQGKYTKDFVTYDAPASAIAGTTVFSNYKGAALSFPKLSYGGSIAYGWSGAGLDWRAEANYSYHDTYKQLLLLGPDYTVDAYWLVNASLAFNRPGSPWTFSVWSRNLLNAKYDLTRNYFLTGTQIAAAGEPRTIGIRVKYDY